MRHRLVAGALSLVTAGALTVLPTVVAAAPTDPVVNYANQACDVTMPGGATARVAEQGGRETAQLLDPTAAKTGMFSIDDGGHTVLLPAAKLAAGVDAAAYDTALLAQRQCGWTAPRQPGHATGGYQLGGLTVHTLDLAGSPAAAFVLLTNVDNQNLARPLGLDTTGGLTEINVPVGHYSAVEIISTPDESHYWFVLDPEFTVTPAGAAITLDARTATVTAQPPTTPLPSTLESAAFGVSRGDGVDPADWFDFFDLSPTPVAFSINTFAKPRDGVTVINPAYEFSSPADATTPYQYHITEPTDHVSDAGFPTTVDPAQLATVTRHYDSAQPGGAALSVNVGQPLDEARGDVIGLRGFNLITPGSTRTEYFSAAPDLAWTSVVDGAAGEDELFTAARVYLPGHAYTDTFHQGAEHPGVALDTLGQRITCAACSAGGELQFDIYPLNDNTPGHFAIVGADQASFQLNRNGALVATDTVGPQFVGVAVPNGQATYQLTENVGRSDAPLSGTSQTTWTFTANPGHGQEIPSYWRCLDGGTDCSTLPLLFAYYSADASPADALTAGPHTLHLDVTHQQDSAAPRVTGASVAVSFDDGATWVPATVSGHDGRYAASFTVPASASGGYVGVRVSAWDAAGDRIDQTVQRAYAAQ